jgi:hypothetical protein
VLLIVGYPEVSALVEPKCVERLMSDARPGVKGSLRAGRAVGDMTEYREPNINVRGYKRRMVNGGCRRDDCWICASLERCDIEVAFAFPMVILYLMRVRLRNDRISQTKKPDSS